MAWKDLTIAQRSQYMNMLRPYGLTLSEMRQFVDNALSSSLVERTDKYLQNAQAPVYGRGGREKKTKVEKGESWISIANKYGVPLPHLLEWNGIHPASSETLPTLQPGQELYIGNPYSLSPSHISAKAPEDYVDYGPQGRDLITNYARAVAQGTITFNQVPKEYQSAVYQRGITLKTDKAAEKIFKTGLNTALFLSNPIGYTTGYVAQKGAAYLNDAASGRHEYSAKDILGYTPVMGTEYAQEHPMKALGVDVLTGMVGGAAIRNAGTLANNARQAFQNAAATTGLERQTLAFPQFSYTKGTFGSVFQSGTKGVGKTGTQYLGRGASGYRPVISTKGTFSHNASGAPGMMEVVGYTTPSGALPISPLPYSGALAPINWINREPRVGVKRNDRHIREEQTFSSWQNQDWKGEQSDYVPGTGLFTIKGDAPIGQSIANQALTQETLTITPGEFVPRKAVYVPGTIEGTPSDVYSGLGITYGSQNPKSLIFGIRTHDDGGDKEQPYNGEIRQGKKWTIVDHYLADNPKVAHGFRKLGRLIDDAGRIMLPQRTRDVEINPRILTDLRDISEQMTGTDNPDSAVDRMSRIATPAAAIARIGKPLLDRLNEETLPWAEGARGFANKLRIADRIVNMGQFIDDFATPVEQFKNGGSIHIKKENRGKFTALKKRTGHSASWFKAHGTPAQKKMATFALNARKWKHEHGGIKF